MARKTGSHAEITGPRVRAAALRRFAEQGFAAVSMREIAGDVGVRAGALYRYTPDKETLLFDLMREHLEALLSAWAELKAEGPALARLDAFVRFHIRYHLERPDEVFIAYMELRNLAEENFSAIEALRRRYEAELEAILSDGQAEGTMALADIRLGAMAIIAMLTGVTTWYRADGRLGPDEVADIYRGMVRGMVAPAPG